MRPFEIVRRFEIEVAIYTGAPCVVATTSCSMAIFLVLQYLKAHGKLPPEINIPKHTYVSIPMGILHAGSRPTFRDETWRGVYQLKPLLLWDAARRFTKDMYLSDECGIGFGHIMATSHHWSKILGIQQAGCILHNDDHMDRWLRRARFDGRSEGVPPKADSFDQLGWHAYLSPEIAAEGLVRLSFLPRDNPDLPTDDYPNLAEAPIFQ